MTDAFVVLAGAPLSGRVRVSGATKNLGLKQMAAALLAPGVTTLRNMRPRRRPRRDDRRAARGRRRRRVDRRARARRSTRRDRCNPEAPYELVTRMRASFNVLGPLLARCGEARVAMPGGDNIGSRKVDMHLARPRGDGRRGRRRARLHRGRASSRLARRAHRARVPERRRDREPAHRRGARQGPDRDRERGARARDHRPRGVPRTAWARSVLGAGTSTIEIEGVESLEPVDTEIMGDRIEAGTLLMACGIAGGEITLVGARLEHLEIVAMKLCEMGMQGVADARRALGARRRAAARGRRRDAAVPGLRHRLHAARGRAAGDRRRHRDRHRERLRRPVPVRRRARPDGRRRAARGPPRGRPRRRAALGRAGAGPRRAGRRRARARRASRPTARRSCSTASTSTAATPTSPPRSGRSAPTSIRTRRVGATALGGRDAGSERRATRQVSCGASSSEPIT